MTSKRTKIVVAALVSGTLAAAIFLVGVERSARREDVEPPTPVPGSPSLVHLSPGAVRRAAVEIVDVESRPLSLVLRVTGRVQLNEDRSARVGSPVEGRVVAVDAVLGEAVETGAPLVRLYAHELAAATADYFKSAAGVTVAEREHRYAREEKARAERLYTAKAISKRESLRASVAAEGALAELDRARAELARAEDVLRQLDAQPNQGAELVIRAPLPGVVLERNATVGTVVKPGDDLVVLSDVSSLWVLAEVPEGEVGRVRVGQSAAVAVAAYPERSFPGTIFQMDQVLDRRTRTLKVRVIVENAGGALRPEMYANIEIDLGETEPVLGIPSAAVYELGGAAAAFVAHGDGTFERRFIDTGKTAGGWIEVTHGLSEGEQIVVAGGFLIKSEFLKSSLEDE